MVFIYCDVEGKDVDDKNLPKKEEGEESSSDGESGEDEDEQE